MEIVFGSKEGSAPAPVIDVQTTIVSTDTPVEGLKVESVGTTAVAVSQLPATRPSGLKIGDKLPGFADVILPTVTIVHPLSETKATFEEGELLFNNDTVLYSPPVIDKKTGAYIKPASAPATLTVIGVVREQFAEKVEGSAQGIIVNSEDEVRANGGTLDYQEWESKKSSGMRRFQPLTKLLVAVQKPDGLNDASGLFGFDVDGKGYTVGFWSLKGAAYTQAMKKGFYYHRILGVLRGGYYTHSFSVSTRLTPAKGKIPAYWAPLVLPNAKTTPAFLDFVQGIVGV